MSPPDELSGHIAFVTGAASGIGRATALLFAARGAEVACVDIAEAGCVETARLITDAAGEALSIQADMAQESAVRAAVDQTVATFGRIDHAFNNAGVTGSHVDPFDIEKWKRTIDINLFGVIHCMKYQIPQMVTQGGGTIVNTASIAGISGAVGAVDYTAAKHGVVGATGALARRYGAQGVRLNSVRPGLIETPMTEEIEQDPERRPEIYGRLSPITQGLGEPADIAEAVLFLSSRKSKFIHGVALPVDGGFFI